MVQPPEPDEIREWWEWALIVGTGPPNSPFSTAAWPPGVDRNDRNQVFSVYCISCTAGAGGPGGGPPRPLANAVTSRKPILVPVLVAIGDSLATAREELGTSAARTTPTPAVQFFVEYGGVLQPDNFFYRETPLGEVNFPAGSDFLDPGQPPGRRRAFSVGYWAKVPNEVSVTRIEFGGSGGRAAPGGGPFNTQVRYEF
jgi:hypothetical protein